MTLLTTHFTLEEFIRSAKATELGIDNTPIAEIHARLKKVAEKLEEIRELLGGVPIKLLSGYRCPKLNAAVGGQPSSQHQKGDAADFIAPAYGSPHAVAERIVASKIKFDQIILEHKSIDLIHVSVSDKPRMMVLTQVGRNFLPGLM